MGNNRHKQDKGAIIYFGMRCPTEDTNPLLDRKWKEENDNEIQYTDF